MKGHAIGSWHPDTVGDYPGCRNYFTLEREFRILLTFLGAMAQ